MNLRSDWRLMRRRQYASSTWVADSGFPTSREKTGLNSRQSARILTRLIQRAATEMPEAHMVIELGRYLVGEAGIYVARVVNRKVSRGQTFLVVDGGLNHHLSASGNFGQVIRKNYPVAIGNRMASGERETATVVGPLCTPLDLLADRMELAIA